MANNNKILIVEDERPMAHALELKLNHSGYETKNAFNGEEALNFLKNEKFDLVLLDIMMPKLDGFGVLKELKNTGNTTPVVMLSNLSQPDDEKKARELGAVDFFIKSNISIAEIMERIQKYFKK